MKNYYEMLEVNPKASKEVIEKAYRVLVRKYHPDLYSGEKQQYAEKKTKEINEAYKILSDEFLREQYDTELAKEEIMDRKNSYQTQRSRVGTNSNSKNNSNNLTEQGRKNPLQKREYKPQVGSFGSILQLMKQLIQDLAKSKEKREQIKEVTRQDVFAIVLTIIVVILIGVILWFIPFTNSWMRELLFENPLFNWIGGLFSK